MGGPVPALKSCVLALLIAAAASSVCSAWDSGGVPPDYEGPPWGSDRFQRVSIRAAFDYCMPVWGKSGGIAAPYAPDYAAGWQAGMGGFGELEFYFCPGYSVSLAVESCSFAPAQPKTVSGVTWDFGRIDLTSVALFVGVHMPFELESELWRCTVAPAAAGFVLYGKLGAGVALQGELEVDTIPPPAVAAPWWKSGPTGFASARIGLEYRFLRYAALFVEAFGGGFLPQGGSDWPGAREASAFAYAGGRAGLCIMI